MRYPPSHIALSERALQKPKKAPALDPSLLHAVNLPKPQLKFRQPVDNFTPWHPIVGKKKLGTTIELRSSQPHFELDFDDPRKCAIRIHIMH